MKKKPSQMTKGEWHHFDAAQMPLGRLASRVATLLMGKHRVDYRPHLVSTVFVVITNTDNVVVTGRKEDQKQYHRYSGYPGGLRTRLLKEQRQKDSRKIVEAAVFGMLPKNSLRATVMKHLKLYPGERHPHLAQFPPRVKKEA